MSIIIGWLVRMGLSQRVAGWVGRLIPLALVFALCGALWVRGEHFKAEAATEHAGRIEDRTKWREAFVAAFVKAWVAKTAEETRTRIAKEKADAIYLEKVEGDRDRAAAYAAANRCVRAATGNDQGRAGRADLPGPGAAAEQPKGAGDLAELVGISRADLDVCTVNSRRLENAVTWAQDYERAPPRD